MITITYITWNIDCQASKPPAIAEIRANVSITLTYDCNPSFTCLQLVFMKYSVLTTLQRLAHFILTCNNYHFIVEETEAQERYLHLFLMQKHREKACECYHSQLSGIHSKGCLKMFMACIFPCA